MVGIVAAKLAVKVRRVVFVGGVLAAWFLTAGPAPYVGAQEVQALVCSGPAAVIISKPTSDIVTADSTVELSGAVRQANQLEVYVDDALDTVVPLSAASTTYAASVQLEAGTHTVKVVAIDACQIHNAAASIVLTYQPAAPQSSVGASVPTQVDNGSGVRIGPAPATRTPTSSALPSLITRPLQQFSDALDLNTPQTSAASQGALSPPVRFGLVLASGLIVIFSQTISAAGATGHALSFVATRMGMHRVSGSRLLTIVAAAVGIIVAFLL